MTLISSSPTEELQRLSERLFSLAKDHGHVFVLIDRFNPLPEAIATSIKAAAFDAGEQCALHDPIFGEAEHLAPQLLQLTVQQLPLLHALAEVAVQAALDPEQPDTCVSGFLVAPDSSTKRLAVHLSRHFDPATYDGRRIFLRFHDPRVLPRLWDLLDGEQRRNLLGPIDRWVLPSRDGDLVELQAATSKAGNSRARVSLAEHAMNGALRIEMLNLAVRSLRIAGHAVSPSEDGKIDQAISRAQRMGMSSAEDLAAYAALAWLWPASHGPMEVHTQVVAGIYLARRGLPFKDYANERLLPIIQSDSKP